MQVNLVVSAQVPPVGLDATEYDTANPPVEPAFHVTVASALPAFTDVMVGAPGEVVLTAACRAALAIPEGKTAPIRTIKPTSALFTNVMPWLHLFG
jgi:hypothetical protein